MTAELVKFPKRKWVGREVDVVPPQRPEKERVRVPPKNVLLRLGCGSPLCLDGDTHSGVLTFECADGYEWRFTDYRAEHGFPASSLIEVPEEWAPKLTFHYHLKPELDGSLGYSLHLQNPIVDDTFWIAAMQMRRKGRAHRRQFVKVWWDCPCCGQVSRSKQTRLYIRLDDGWVGCECCLEEPEKYIELCWVSEGRA